MIQSNIIRELMLNSISQAKQSTSEGNKPVPKVGAVIATKEGKVLLTAFRGESKPGQHCEYEILEKAKQQRISLSDAMLFVTLEPCTVRGKGKIPCSQRIIDSGLKVVYIGMLDPNPLIRGKGEMFLRENGIIVERYPDKLIRELNEINTDFMNEFRGSFLVNDTLFSQMKIADILKDLISKQGIIVPKLPSSFGVTLEDIVSCCASANIGMNQAEIEKIILKSLGDAYDKKYLDRTFESDVRGKNAQWLIEFNSILREYHINSLKDRDVLVVGIGNGQEGKYLYNDANRLTFVDIAPKSLARAVQLFDNAKKINLAAQNLSKIKTSSVDLYSSLMTYQSSFFDIGKAITEAYRVLRPDGIIIISVSCGYIDKENYVFGLVDNNSNFVDSNLPFKYIEKIREKFTALHFSQISIKTTLSEIFISGRKNI